MNIRFYDGDLNIFTAGWFLSSMIDYAGQHRPGWFIFSALAFALSVWNIREARKR